MGIDHRIRLCRGCCEVRQVLQWILQYSTQLKDLGLLVFAAVGALFAFRAWRQKNDEIKEKYFERRYALYVEVSKCVAQGKLTSNSLEWWQPLLEAKSRAEFLVSAEAAACIAELHDHLIGFKNALDSSDEATRVGGGRKFHLEIDADFAKFKAMLTPLLKH